MDIYGPLAEEFELKRKGGWSSFHHPLARTSVGSSRVGKVMPSGVVLFTFGETVKGKRLGMSAKLVEVIEGAGLAVVKEPSTAGQRRLTSIYVGFEPLRATKEQGRSVLKQVLAMLQSAATA